MKIVVVGTGFVGLTHAAVCSEYGHDVYAYDTDETRLAAYRSADATRLEQIVNEPGLASIVAENLERNLFFVSELEPILTDAEAVFLCLNTPPKPDGSSDLTIYSRAAHHLAELLARRTDRQRIVVINKSTVPIGTARLLQRILAEHGVQNVGVASNPEFLPEGDAVEKSRRPDRVVVGADDEEDFSIMRRVYSQFIDHVRIRYIETSPETAECIKYVANTLLLTYISFWNGVGARLGETMPNVRLDDLKLGVTADTRISTWGSFVSNGAGGSCFGKDIQSLIYQLAKSGQPTDLLQSVYDINEYQKTYLIDRVVHETRFSFNQKSVAILGLAFKQRTNDVRDSSSLRLIDALLARGVRHIRAYDPLANHEAQRALDPTINHLFEKISYFDSAREAITESDVCIISTDWEEFRSLSRTIEQTVPPPYLVIDGRRMIFDHADLTKLGYAYLAVGSVYDPPALS